MRASAPASPLPLPGESLSEFAHANSLAARRAAQVTTPVGDMTTAFPPLRACQRPSNCLATSLVDMRSVNDARSGHLGRVRGKSQAQNYYKSQDADRSAPLWSGQSEENTRMVKRCPFLESAGKLSPAALTK